MYADFTTKPQGSASGPAYDSYPELEAVYNLAPSILIDALPKYVKGSESYNQPGSFGLVNLADEALFVAEATSHPMAISGGALEFGANRGIVHETERSLTMSGNYTVAWVARNKSGGGGMFMGSRKATNQSYIGYGYGTEALTITHNGSAMASWTVGWTVDVWQSGIASYSPTDSKVYWWRNGALLGSSTVTPSSWGAGAVMLGGIGDKLPLAYLGGDIAALAVFDGTALSDTAQADNLAAVQAWLAAVKARL